MCLSFLDAVPTIATHQGQLIRLPTKSREQKEEQKAQDAERARKKKEKEENAKREAEQKKAEADAEAAAAVENEGKDPSTNDPESAGASDSTADVQDKASPVHDGSNTDLVESSVQSAEQSEEEANTAAAIENEGNDSGNNDPELVGASDSTGDAHDKGSPANDDASKADLVESSVQSAEQSEDADLIR